MPYPSIDELQKALAIGVFANRKDKKKAAGRALGTIVELVTFYLLRQWGFGSNITIELALPEFGNGEITHNVEFGVHAKLKEVRLDIATSAIPISAKKVRKALGERLDSTKANSLLSKSAVLRNACVVDVGERDVVVANVVAKSQIGHLVDVATLRKHPFAMVECKRVGVEEGMKKGPTTIEKAKQGAYVAKHVSALQKIRSADGSVVGAMAKPDGTIELRPWREELDRLIHAGTPEELASFILTVGVVSNHGNWFSADDPNKELRVLQQSYDWLIFLNDDGIAEFVSDVLTSESTDVASVRNAFHASYADDSDGNQFTKVKISQDAHNVLIRYFEVHIDRIESNWLSVLSPVGESIQVLKDELRILRDKEWHGVVAPEDSSVEIGAESPGH